MDSQNGGLNLSRGHKNNYHTHDENAQPEENRLSALFSAALFVSSKAFLSISDRDPMERASLCVSGASL
jgi:hypothetical protein